MTDDYLVSKITELACPEPGTGGCLVTLRSGFTNFSRPDIRLGARQPPTVADSSRPVGAIHAALL